MVWSALLLGLISSLHCAAMCAPLQVMVISQGSSQAHKKHVFYYHTARICTYAFLGAFAGLLGKGLGIQAWQQEASLLSGLFLLAGFAAFYLLKLDRKLLKILFPYLNRMRGTLAKNKGFSLVYFGGSGMVNGLLPCGMVYLALFPAMASDTWWLATGYMVLFGLGTLPTLLLANMSGIRFLQTRGLWLQKAIPVFVVLTAFLLIVRGMDLGIPYLSPKIPNEINAGVGCK